MKKALLAGVAVFGLLLGACSPSDNKPQFPDRVARVIDGDTLEMADGRRVRVKGVDTPELRGECEFERRHAQQAKMMVEAWTRNGVRLEVSGRPDRYGRTLAVVHVPHGHDLAHWLIQFELGRPYNGGRRQPWC